MSACEEAVTALAAAGVPAELERNDAGQLLLTVRGEAVHSWNDDEGVPYVTVVVAEDGGSPAAG